MEVAGKVLYHVHRKTCEANQWYVGNVIEFSKMRYNYFFNYYIHNIIRKSDDNIDPHEKIKEYATLIRELIYEEVRSSRFKELPSRRHCIWLCDIDSLGFWRNNLYNDCEIYKVEVTGNLHECYADTLDDDNINYEILYKTAIDYWSGVCYGNHLEKEYLLEGEIKIIEKI